MKFILIESRYLTEGTDYRKKAIQELVSSGLYDEETATAIVDDDIKTNQVGIIRHNNWMTKIPLMIVKKMLKYAENKQNKHQAIADFENQFHPAISKWLEIKNNERSKLTTEQEKIDFSAKCNQEFENMSVNDIQKFADEIDRKNKEESDAELANMKFDSKSDYELIPIDSYEQMNDMFGGIATGDGQGISEWCHTNGKGTYNSWVEDGKYKFFVLAKKNWRNIKFDPESNARNPKDEYGNSLIAILVRCGSNKLEKATLRCNHIGVPVNADNQYSKYSELSEIAGFNVEEKINQIIPKKEVVDIKQLYKVFDGTKESLNKILDKADIDKEDLTEFIIPNSVTSIGYAAFYCCRSLSKITIPNSVTSIGDCAFLHCSNLSSIMIPDSVTSIGASAFDNCRSLESITIPDSVTSIGEEAFYQCENLEKITIPDSVTSIGNSAFSGCCRLRSIIIPNSVTSIGNSAFSGCFGMADKNGLVIVKNVVYDCKSDVTNITIPDSVTTIGDWAFAYCSSLSNIVFPDSVTTIGYGAFERCRGLSNIVIPDSVRLIGNLAFNGCSNLTIHTKNPIAISHCEKHNIKYVKEGINNMKFKLLVESKADQDNFRNWLLKEYSNSGLPEVIYTSNVDSMVQQFDKYKTMNKFSDPAKKDYYYWINKHTPSELTNELIRIHDELEQKRYDKQLKKELLSKGAKEIFNKDNYKGYLVTDYDAMKYIGSGTEWCVAGSKRWQNDASDIDPETQGRRHFIDQLIGSGYYVLITPDKITWEVEDNGIRNEYSGVDKFCVQYDASNIIVWNVHDTKIWHDEPEYTLENKFEFTQHLRNDRGVSATSTKMLLEFIQTILSKYPYQSKLASCVKDNVLIIDDDAYEILDSMEPLDWNNEFRAVTKFKKLDLLITCSDFEFVYGLFKNTNFNKVTITSNCDTLDYISQNAFEKCSITEFECHAPQLNRIDSNAFLFCDNLKKILINSDEELGLSYNAINECKSLESINISSGLYLEKDSIDWCEHLKYLHCQYISGDIDEVGEQFESIKTVEIDDKDNAEELKACGYSNIM